MFTAMSIARYQKKKRWWYTIHKRLNLIGAGAAAIGMVIAVIMVALSHGVHIASLHAVLGVLTFILVIVTPIIGYGIRSPKVNPTYKKQVRIVHHWLGRFTLLSIALTIFFGLQIAGLI
jgi:hypothetical protein